MVLTQADLISSLREHLQRQGFLVSHSIDKDSLSVEIAAEKGREKFLIEAIWETEQVNSKSITFAIGKVVKRMKERGFWINYGLAIPKSYFRLLGEFEAGGFEALNLHVFLVDTFYTLTHLDTKMAVELIEGVKSGDIADLDIWSVNYG
jgi:hypothetical protein